MTGPDINARIPGHRRGGPICSNAAVVASSKSASRSSWRRSLDLSRRPSAAAAAVAAPCTPGTRTQCQSLHR